MFQARQLGGKTWPQPDWERAVWRLCGRGGRPADLVSRKIISELEVMEKGVMVCFVSPLLCAFLAILTPRLELWR